MKLDDLVNFRTGAAEADFLFGPEIPEYIGDIYQRGLKLWRANVQRREQTPGYDPKTVAEQLNSDLIWITQQSEVAKAKFRQYLDISK